MVRIEIALGLLSLFIPSYNALSNDGSVCSQFKSTEKIPETSLKTGTFYRVTTQNTTNRFMTWSYKSHPTLGHRYIISDVCKTYCYKYEKGGPNYHHAQWFFLPAKRHPGWYHLANRGIPGEFASWSHKDDEKIANEKFYLILDPSYEYSSECLPKLEYLFKPVRKGTSYQLKLKALPDAVIDVNGLQERSCRFFVFANTKVSEISNYKDNDVWFYSTLFNFRPVEDEGKYKAQDT